MRLTFRPVSLKDSEVLYKWRNDALTRASSHQSHVLSFDEHSSWLKNILGNDKHYIYIFELNEQPVGTVRYDSMEENCGKLSWTVAPEMRHKGIGKKMVKMATMQFGGKLVAEIKEDNYGSKKIAAYIGMRFLYKIKNIEYWSMRRSLQNSNYSQDQTILEKESQINN